MTDVSGLNTLDEPAGSPDGWSGDATAACGSGWMSGGEAPGAAICGGGALLAGWAVGMALGTVLSAGVGMKPVYPVPGLGMVYIGLIALAANLVLAALLTLIANARGLARAADATQVADYEDAPASS